MHFNAFWSYISRHHFQPLPDIKTTMSSSLNFMHTSTHLWSINSWSMNNQPGATSLSPQLVEGPHEPQEVRIKGTIFLHRLMYLNTWFSFGAAVFPEVSTSLGKGFDISYIGSTSWLQSLLPMFWWIWDQLVSWSCCHDFPSCCHAFSALMDTVPLKLWAQMSPFFLVMLFYHNWKVVSTVLEHLLYATYKEICIPCATKTFYDK